MNAMKTLLTYAVEQIEKLNLGDGGPLGTKFVAAYAANGGKVRLSDGHAYKFCGSEAEVNTALQTWIDWINEN